MNIARTSAIAFLLFASCAQAETVRLRNGRRLWATPGAWSNAVAPTDIDKVRIASPTQPTGIIRPGETAVAGTLIVGDGTDYLGSLEIKNGSLNLERRRAAGVSVGHFWVGALGGVGVVQQEGGKTYTSRALAVGTGKDGNGTYRLKNGVLTTGSIELGSSHATATGHLSVIGSSSSVRTEKLTCGPGTCTLSLQADAFGLPVLDVASQLTLRGTLHVDLSRLDDRAAEIMLIKVRGRKKVRGGFSQIQLLGGRQYEVAYDGGSGNDVVLRRVDGTDFAEWANDRLGNIPTGRPGWRRDSDNDGRDDLTEYKLGSQPHHDEEWDSPQFDGARSRLIYTERISRNDARITPQVKVNGQWRSDRIRLDVLSEAGDTRIVEASYTGQLTFRMYSELLPDPKRAMNVVLFVVDDLNDWIGSLGGHAQAKTPTMDELASRGCLFTNAHANAPNCNASRSSFLTGIYPASSGVYEHANQFDDNPVMRTAVTLPEHFSENNYRCLGSGKIFHAGGPDVWHDYGPVLSEVGDVRDGGDFHTSQPHLEGGPSEQPARDFFDYKAASWTANRISKMKASRPHFIATGFYRPHLPWFAPEQFFDPFPLRKVLEPPRLATDLDDVPSTVFDRGLIKTLDDDAIIKADLWQKAIRAYLACSSFADTQVKRVIKELDSSPTINNTIIVLISDHGHHLGEKHTWRKGTLWQESTRIPMIIVAPGVAAPGSRVRAPVSLIDIYPTLTELTDTTAPRNQLEGRSLVPAMRGDEIDEENWFVVATRRYRSHVIINNDWRYIRYSTNEEELYDVRADRNEWTNLATDPSYLSTIKDLRKHLPTTNTRP